MNEFVRYTTASAIAFMADMGALYLLTEWLGLYYLLSAIAGFCLGATVAYTLSIKWAFSHRSLESAHQEFLLFVTIGIVGLGLNVLLIWSLTELTGLHYLYSKISATIFVFLFNYLARRKLLFTPSFAERSNATEPR